MIYSALLDNRGFGLVIFLTFLKINQRVFPFWLWIIMVAGNEEFTRAEYPEIMCSTLGWIAMVSIFFGCT